MMAIMGSSKPKSDLLYDPIRKKWVTPTPEEVIRQRLLVLLIEKLNYPAHLIAVEKELSQLPHLKLTSPKEIPKKRADIIVFAKDGEVIAPQLLIECKATALTPQFAQQ